MAGSATDGPGVAGRQSDPSAQPGAQRLLADLDFSGVPAPGPARERADAVRNRERVLQAARRLFRERDPRTVTMEELARAAGVGRATLYRRYRDPAAVAMALLDEHERRLQERLIRGEPPLGPGAPPQERLCAFYAAMVELLEEHLPLALGGETGAARFRTGAYGFWHLHVRILLTSAGADDPEALADTLLAPLAPELYQHQRQERGLDPERIVGSLGQLARAVLAGPTPPDDRPVSGHLGNGHRADHHGGRDGRRGEGNDRQGFGAAAAG